MDINGCNGYKWIKSHPPNVEFPGLLRSLEFLDVVFHIGHIGHILDILDGKEDKKWIQQTEQA